MSSLIGQSGGVECRLTQSELEKTFSSLQQELDMNVLLSVICDLVERVKSRDKHVGLSNILGSGGDSLIICWIFLFYFILCL